jgi:hypothetical protein
MLKFDMPWGGLKSSKIDFFGPSIEPEIPSVNAAATPYPPPNVKFLGIL